MAAQGTISMQKGMLVRVKSVNVGVMEVAHAHALLGHPGLSLHAYYRHRRRIAPVSKKQT